MKPLLLLLVMLGAACSGGFERPDLERPSYLPVPREV